MLTYKVLAAVLGAAFLLTGILVLLRERTLRRAYREAGEALGWAFARPRFSGPMLRFNLRGLPGLLTSQPGSRYVPAATTLTIQPPDRWSGHLRVRTRNALSDLSGRLSGEVVETRDDAFDATFLATGRPEELCLRLLDTGMRSRIVNIARYEAAVEVLLHEGAFSVSRLEVLETAASLQEFASSALSLLEAVLDTVESLEGISFLSEEGDPVEHLPFCQICGTPIEESPVFCRRCATPHHRDCWTFNRGCSTFGCQGKRYSRRAPRS